MKIDIPGFKILELEYLILDYNGTIAADGMIPEDIVRRLKMLAEKFRIYIVTADTHGNAREACAKLPVEVYTFPSRDAAHAKRELVENLEAKGAYVWETDGTICLCSRLPLFRWLSWMQRGCMAGSGKKPTFALDPCRRAWIY